MSYQQTNVTFEDIKPDTSVLVTIGIKGSASKPRQARSTIFRRKQPHTVKSRGWARI